MRATVVGLALAVACASHCFSQQTTEPLTASHDGQPVLLRIGATPKATLVRIGPWRLGTRLKQTKRGKPDKISDKRINLYFIVPGTQFQSRQQPEFDHNLLVNIAPPEEGESPIETEADLFWVTVIDPKLTTEIRTESDLILLAQERFTPNDLYAFEDSPGAAILRENAKVESILDLARFRDRSGTLPRILILPANAILSVTIERP